ncbi:hypothetical protein [Chitinophaga sp. LS1]|uniref:hypothetical protein n=1 Tax=Chitinophaga sp. LS1 TaxID=3051176 RepID=UPI002AAB9356|nr:hypothetical protein [Chitinophaga sp. LS1]WPV65520.1 hypothetical protein QQL36_27335 [Chitinophaga sp. LS1]
MNNKNLQQLLKQVIEEESKKAITPLNEADAYLIRGGARRLEDSCTKNCTKKSEEIE